MNVMKPPTWATSLEKPGARVLPLQAHDSSKLSYVFGYASPRFGLLKIGSAPKGPPKPPNTV